MEECFELKAKQLDAKAALVEVLQANKTWKFGRANRIYMTLRTFPQHGTCGKTPGTVLLEEPDSLLGGSCRGAGRAFQPPWPAAEAAVANPPPRILRDAPDSRRPKAGRSSASVLRVRLGGSVKRIMHHPLMRWSVGGDHLFMAIVNQITAGRPQ